MSCTKSINWPSWVIIHNASSSRWREPISPSRSRSSRVNSSQRRYFSTRLRKRGSSRWRNSSARMRSRSTRLNRRSVRTQSAYWLTDDATSGTLPSRKWLRSSSVSSGTYSSNPSDKRIKPDASTSGG